MGTGEGCPYPCLLKPRAPRGSVRVENVEYEDGKVYVYSGDCVLEREYTPALLVDPRVVPFLPERLEGKEHPHALEVRGDLDYLVDVQREVSFLTNAYLFIEPERQFLLEKGFSIGSYVVDGMPSLRLPVFSSWRDALKYLLRTERGPAARTFLENVFYVARVAADLSRVGDVRLPPQALRVVLDLNLCPTTVGSPGVLLPASRVRVSVPLPFTYPSTDPILRKRFGGSVPVRDGGLVPLADAEVLGLDYRVAVPFTASASPGAVQRGIGELLSLFLRMASRARVKGADIEEYALRSGSEGVVSAYAYMEAVSRVLLPLPSFLASTNALTPVGRVNYLTGWELYRREPNAYKRLYASSSTCSPVSKGLECFLLALSSLPLELPRWWKCRGA